MAAKRHKAEEIVTKLRQVDVLNAQGKSMAEAIRSIGVTEVTHYRWRAEYGGLKGDQVKRLKELGGQSARDSFMDCCEPAARSPTTTDATQPHPAEPISHGCV